MLKGNYWCHLNSVLGRGMDPMLPDCPSFMTTENLTYVCNQGELCNTSLNHMNPTHRLSQQGLYQPRMPRGEKCTKWSPTVEPAHNGLPAGAHCLFLILPSTMDPVASLDTYNKVSAPAEHLGRHATVRAGRVLGIQDVTGKQANAASQSPSVVPPPPLPTLAAQGSQSEPV